MPGQGTADGGEQPDPTTVHVRRALTGDDGSLGWLVGHLNPLLLRAARYRLGPLAAGAHAAEDLVQDAWLVALPKLPSLTPRDGRWTPVLLRYLSTTILHRARNILRQQARRATHESTSQRPSDLSGAVTRAMQRELSVEVDEALGKLSEDERAVVLLRGVEQHSNHDVGTMLGCSAEAVSKRYQRALARLRGLLPRSVFDELPE